MHWRPNIKNLILFGIIVSVFCWLYSDTIYRLVLKWSSSGDYSHGFLIPLICLYLIWKRQNQLKQTRVTPCWWGLPILLLAVISLLIAKIGAIYSAASFSLLIGGFGLVILNLGLNITKNLAFPLGFLIFAIPLPGLIRDSVTFPLTLASSNISTRLMRLFEITVNREGNIIDLGTMQLQVVEACSGLRFVLPLLALGILVAYFTQQRFWKRVLLVLSTIPISIIANACRLAMIGILAEKFGADVAEGFFHGFSGWLVFIFAFSVLYLENMALNKIGQRRQMGLKEAKPAFRVETSSPPLIMQENGK